MQRGEGEDSGSSLRRSARKNKGQGGSSGTDEVDSESAAKTPTRKPKSKQQQDETTPLDAEESRKVAGGRNVTFRDAGQEQTGQSEANSLSRNANSTQERPVYQQGAQVQDFSQFLRDNLREVNIQEPISSEVSRGEIDEKMRELGGDLTAFAQMLSPPGGGERGYSHTILLRCVCVAKDDDEGARV